MQYSRHSPSAQLTPFVRCYWTLQSEPGGPPPAVERILPDGGMELVFHRHEPFEIADAEAMFRRQAPAFLYGQIHQAILLRPPDRANTLGVSFRPAGAYPFLGAPAHELAGLAVDLESLWGRAGREIEERVLAAPTDRLAIAAIEGALMGRLAAAGSADRALEASLGAIRERRGRVAIRQLANRVGLGERRLERAFRDRVGLSPKGFARIVRFQTAVGRIERDRGISLAQVAQDAGYFDQAHFGREFRRIAGTSPLGFLREKGMIARQLAWPDDVGSVQDGCAERA